MAKKRTQKTSQREIAKNQKIKKKIVQKVLTKDGSYSAFSKEYNQHYHNVNDGALKESLHKHIIPALLHVKHLGLKKLRVLDICFGLGYNTYALIYYMRKIGLDIPLHVVSPELDRDLVRSLRGFEYPREFDFLQDVILQVSKNLCYEDKKISLHVINDDAREVIKNSTCRYDIVFQDAFSSDVNPTLWTYEYFKELKNHLTCSAVLTTYAVATPVRLGLDESGYYMYENTNEFTKRGTLAFLQKQNYIDEALHVDMQIKRIRNPRAKALRD